MSPLVYIVRHGQTDWNVAERLQGQADIDINAQGRGEATGNGRRLAELIVDPQDFDFVASPMIRTRHTMELVRQAMGLPASGYTTDPRLMEMNFGDWQGYTIAEVEQRYPGSTRGRVLDKWDFRPPGDAAESYQMLLERVRPFFEALERRTVCVTHGGVIRALFRLVEKVPKTKAGSLDTPQDRILRWQDGHLEWL